MMSLACASSAALPTVRTPILSAAAFSGAPFSLLGSRMSQVEISIGCSAVADFFNPVATLWPASPNPRMPTRSLAITCFLRRFSVYRSAAQARWMRSQARVMSSVEAAKDKRKCGETP